MYKNDIFANEAGVVLQELNEEHAVMTLEVEARHLNAGDVAHGGVLYLLADIAMAAMANFRQPLSVSIQSDIRFLAAAHKGDLLTAVATEVLARRSLYNSRVVITNQNGDLVAVAEGMLHTKRM